MEAAIIAAADMRRALDDAKRALDNANQNLNVAKREDKEAARDLVKAEAALKVVNSKWEVIEQDFEDEHNCVGKKRSAPVAEGDGNEHDKKSKHYHDVNIKDVKSIKVAGCGYPDANGIYHLLKYDDHSNPVFGNQRYVLRRSSSQRRNNIWFILYSEPKRYLYKCILRDCDATDLFRDEWKVIYGYNPPPKLSIIELV